MYHSQVGAGAPIGLLQNGVLRTNCIDCLDRTNVGQFCYANYVLGKQLKSIGIQLSPWDMREVSLLLMQLWSEHGDVLARQYAGSGAMHRVDSNMSIFSALSKLLGVEQSTSKGSGNNNSSSSQKDSRKDADLTLSGGATNAIVAVQRYYSNISTDYERQQAMDILLGEFRPRKGEPAVWDVDLNRFNDERAGHSQSTFDPVRPVPKYSRDWPTAPGVRSYPVYQMETSGRVGGRNATGTSSENGDLSTEKRQSIPGITVSTQSFALENVRYHTYYDS
jgi:hypothetical protein